MSAVDSANEAAKTDSGAEVLPEAPPKPEISDSAQKVDSEAPTEDPLSLPPNGTEVFIGGIPKDATEEQIREFAEQVGQVHSVKLSMDPQNPGMNRGYSFVRYFVRECAETAKEKLADTNLKGTNAMLRVSNSQSKHKLYIGNLPRSWTKEQIEDDLKKHTIGLESFDLVQSKDEPNENRGFAFMCFYNHECAAYSKEQMSKNSFKLDNRTLTISYAEQKGQQQEHSQPSKSVYIGNLPAGASEDGLRAMFDGYGDIVKVVIPAATEKRPEQRFGFVHYSDYAGAERAVAAAEGKTEWFGNMLEVKAARPLDARAFNSPIINPHHNDNRGRMMPDYNNRHNSGRRMKSTPRGGYGGGRGGGGGGGGGGHMVQQQYDNYNVYPSYDQVSAYGNYGASVPAAGAVAGAAGMTMVPMMLPSGQVGYVLQTAEVPNHGPARTNSNYNANTHGHTSHNAHNTHAQPHHTHTHNHHHNNNNRSRGRGTQNRYRPY